MKSIWKDRRVIGWVACVAALLLFAAPAVHAQAQENIANLSTVDDNVTADDSHDPPSRVARISVIDGSVSMQPGGTGDWGNAMKNRPVTIGDKLWVDKDSRVELQAGQASIHLGSMTALSFLNLDQNIIQMRLPEGKVNFRVREIRQGEIYEIDTPNMAFTVKEAGAFRVDVNENGDFTGVTVIRGSGEIAASGQVTPVNAGQHADVNGADGSVQIATSAAPQADALDQWAQQRDLAEDNSVSSKYVNRDVVGYSDLDDYGKWKEEPEYGNVWVPNNVPEGWAPYSNGYWSWVGPWGWTWVDYAPWGFAPYHYGRWNWFGSYWGWCPGPIYSYPYYGPAFVGFVGGFGWGVGFGWGWGGGYGWFPLGWGEPYHPWYHCGYGYWNNVNIHNTYIRNFHMNNPHAYNTYNYAYARNVHAVTTASHNDFVNGRSINRANQHLTAASLRNAQVTNRINASPTRGSYLGASAQHGRVATPSSATQNRSVMARTSPAASAAHMPVRTMSSAGLAPGAHSNMIAARPSQNAPQGMNQNRWSQLSANRPPNATQPGGRPGTVMNNNVNNNVRGNGNGSFNNSNRPNSSSPRTWNAQGNSTDSGRAPQGFGANRPSNTMAQPHNDRPPYAGSGASAPQRGSTGRPPASYNGGRSYSPQTYNGGRSYTPPAYGNRSNNAPTYGNRSYSAPSYGNRSYSAPSYGNRSYSAPSYGGPRGGGSYSAPRSYSSAPRSFSAPHSSAPSGGGFHGGGGGGGGGHVSGGGGSHGGGGSRH